MKFDVPSAVIDKLFSNGYEEQIVDFVMACEDKEGLEVSDIPISPTLMGNSGDKVIISPKVYETYMQEEIKSKKSYTRVNETEQEKVLRRLI